MAHLDELSFMLVESRNALSVLAGGASGAAAAAATSSMLVESRAGALSAVAGGAAAGAAISSFLRMTLSRLSLRLAKRSAGLQADGTLVAMEIVDCGTPAGMLGASLIRTIAPAAGAAGSESEPQWSFSFVQSPPGQKVDLLVEVSVASALEVVYNLPLLTRVRSFLDVLGETERAELAKLVREQVSSNGLGRVWLGLEPWAG